MGQLLVLHRESQPIRRRFHGRVFTVRYFDDAASFEIMGIDFTDLLHIPDPHECCPAKPPAIVPL